MNKSIRRNFILVLLWSLILSVVCERGQYDDDNKPSLYQVVSSTISLLKKSHKTSWEKIKTIMHEYQRQFTPPNLDFRGAGTEEAKRPDGVGENMKEAVKKSVETSKATVEETAKSAAEMAGEAVHKTAEKVKGKVSDHEEQPHDEL